MRFLLSKFNAVFHKSPLPRFLLSLLLVAPLFPTNSQAQPSLDSIGVFNGFLGQVNILECENINQVASSFNFKMFDDSGNLLSELNSQIPASGARHLILNDMADIQDRYGVWLLDSSNEITCRTATYKYSDTPGAFDFAYTLDPLKNMSGTTSGGFNTQNPSASLSSFPNFLSVVNMEDRPFSFKVFVYGPSGQALQVFERVLEKRYSRMDLPIAHAEGQLNGSYAIIPSSDSSEQNYSAWLMRYGIKGPNQYSHVLSLKPKAPNCASAILPVSTLGLSSPFSWLELSNSSEISTSATVDLHSENGSFLKSIDVVLPAYSSSHLNMTEHLGPAKKGLAWIKCSEQSVPGSLETVSMEYGLDSFSTLNWAYGVTGSRIGNDNIYQIPLNTFLEMENLLRTKSLDGQSKFNLRVFDITGQQIFFENLQLEPFESFEKELRDILGPDTYGRAIIESDPSLYVDLLRKLPAGGQDNYTVIPAQAWYDEDLPSLDGPDDPNSIGNSSATVDHTSPLGINLGNEVYWSPSWTFVNIMNKAGGWAANQGSLNLDSHGWVQSLEPGQTATTSVYVDSQGLYPAGQYTVLYDGEGTLNYHGSASLFQRQPGKDIINVDPLMNASLRIILGQTNPNNHLRNVRVIQPGGFCANNRTEFCNNDSDCNSETPCIPFTESYASHLFHPNFLASLKGFPLIRFMDWGAINYTNDSSKYSDPKQDPYNYAARNWGTRTTVDQFPWAKSYHVGREIPFEIMFKLAKDLDAESWISIPHLAGDFYVRELAKLAKQNLPSSRKIYVELSNELWNTSFAQGKVVGELEGGLDRSIEIFKIWSEVFGDSASRLVRVFSLQAGNSWRGRQLMNIAQSKGYLEQIDAIAIAPYFGHDWACQRSDDFASWSVERIVQDLKGPGLEIAVDRMNAYGQIAKDFGKDLIAYEGGQHIALYGDQYVAANSSCPNNTVHHNNPAMIEKTLAIASHPGMQDVYNNYLKKWKEAGGKRFALFNHTGKWSKWGTWSFFEGNFPGAEEESPKFQGVQQFRKENPRWW